MCFNQKTSLLTFSISLVCFIYLIFNGIVKKNKYDLFAGLLTILIGSMQLIEYYLWGSQNCSSANHFYSLLIMVVLFLQVVLGSLLFMYLFSDKSQKLCNYFILGSISIYTVFTLYLLNWLNQRKLCSKPEGGSCRLVWAPFQTMINDSFGRILFLIYFSYYFLLGSYAFGGFHFLTKMNFDGHNKYPIRYSLLTFTFLIAVLYAFITNGKNLVDIFGSTWCFLAVAFGVVSAMHL